MMPRLDRLLTLCCFSHLQKLNAANNQATPILMYHSISDAEECVHPYYRINTSPKVFANHMHFLVTQGYRSINLQQLTDKDFNGKSVVITFDDGYRDFLEYAWPILTEFGLTATVFVPTGFIGHSRKYFNGRESLTWSEMRQLARNGVSFGSHSVSHSKLYELQWQEIRRELIDSRMRLEDELQTPVRCFAYPYAFPQEDHRFVLRFKQELADQGYDTAVTTAIGLAQRGIDPLYLKRLPVNEGDDERLLQAKLAGAYDWMAIVQAVARRIKRHRSTQRYD